ncbi:hypothetical protein MOX02_28520 [Methylobacterium oxalidis]|uniref:Uncharacterized protein n=1 Tax=Methylobacterium oxalidis TaxID=944322 RepID=A0A512J4C9_9HYPH|nr:hypothetical protein MOX02_28520 [Methylobacterium oxalidis]GLS63640.1 hypothetical protein GCM10007888_20210 [Methylobacterium oxalidis]
MPARIGLGALLHRARKRAAPNVTDPSAASGGLPNHLQVGPAGRECSAKTTAPDGRGGLHRTARPGLLGDGVGGTIGASYHGGGSDADKRDNNDPEGADILPCRDGHGRAPM